MHIGAGFVCMFDTRTCIKSDILTFHQYYILYKLTGTWKTYLVLCSLSMLFAVYICSCCTHWTLFIDTADPTYNKQQTIHRKYKRYDLVYMICLPFSRINVPKSNECEIFGVDTANNNKYICSKGCIITRSYRESFYKWDSIAVAV